jgi:hypothetical protein
MMRRSVIVVGNNCSPSSFFTRTQSRASSLRFTQENITTRSSNNNNSVLLCVNQSNTRFYFNCGSHGCPLPSSLQPQQQRLFSKSSSSSSLHSSSPRPAGAVYSERSHFQKSPVHDSILQYIEQIGVGRPTPRRQYKLKNKKRITSHRQQPLDSRYPGRRASSPSASSMVYSRRDEDEHFRRQQHDSPALTLLQQQQRRRRRGGGDPNNRTSPPPPFGAPPQGAAVSTEEHGEKHSTIQRLPVKIIGSVGSHDEEFPRGTKGLPEVVRDTCVHPFNELPSNGWCVPQQRRLEKIFF